MNGCTATACVYDFCGIFTSFRLPFNKHFYTYCTCDIQVSTPKRSATIWVTIGEHTQASALAIIDFLVFAVVQEIYRALASNDGDAK